MFLCSLSDKILNNEVFFDRVFYRGSCIDALGTVIAETTVTTYYVDSTCSTPQAVYTYVNLAPSKCFAVFCEEYAGAKNKIAYTNSSCSDSSPADLIGNNEGYIEYSDVICETSSSAY